MVPDVRPIPRPPAYILASSHYRYWPADKLYNHQTAPYPQPLMGILSIRSSRKFYRNAGLDLDSGDHRVISSMVLEAADLDTAPDQVFYFISAAPRFGKLLLKTESSWNELSAGQNFTQEQVEQNRLWYHHRASNTGFRGHDGFRFILSDVDSESLTQSFLISIRTVDRG
ncbi:hypothetical protein AMECASPLE_033468 [Ameca splendens]|uniref:Uncharacterized protein n=1 Tax=Ameca splendens TaxID=208324 RepID=A0ABV0YIL1_9TELE